MLHVYIVYVVTHLCMYYVVIYKQLYTADIIVEIIIK